MNIHIFLASSSRIRAEMLDRAGIPMTAVSPRIDEDSVKMAMLAEEATPRDVADTLAELKARKVSGNHPGQMVLGCDQVLDFKGTLLSKPTSREECAGQLHMLSGHRHKLLSAAVICKDGEPVWRHVGVATLEMRSLSEKFIADYLDRNWDSVRHSVGGYKLEEEGPRILSRVQGDYFHVLGLPLLELVGYLVARGELES